MVAIHNLDAYRARLRVTPQHRRSAVAPALDEIIEDEFLARRAMRPDPLEDDVFFPFDDYFPKSRGLHRNAPRDAAPGNPPPKGREPHPFRDAVALALGAWVLIFLTALILAGWWSL